MSRDWSSDPRLAAKFESNRTAEPIQAHADECDRCHATGLDDDEQPCTCWRGASRREDATRAAEPAQRHTTDHVPMPGGYVTVHRLDY